MRRISDDGLVEIANLNLDFAAGVSDRAKIAHVAIAANPNLRPLWERAAFHSFEPLVIANRIAPHVSMRRSGHLALANVFQTRRASAGTGDTLFVFHDCFFAWISLSDWSREWPRGHPDCRFPLRRQLSGSHLVGLARPDLRQQLFRLHLLLQTFV